ncbi:MAG: hypothetical protein HYS87_02005 [Candidatus Colwellbacteria bacterium]|nr:hypothetical protein [Candidatus Colwellbacteria bacterium]
MTIFEQIAGKIIKEQERIIGPLAWDEASKVPGLEVINKKTGEIIIHSDVKDVLDKLVAQYERLFGRASHEVCREAAHSMLTGIAPTEVPSSLK